MPLPKKKLETKDLIGVEILNVGTWHGSNCPPSGCEFTEQDLDDLVTTFEATKDLLQPPAKLGHSEDQPLLQEDGYPAAGWLTNLRREGKKLLTDIVKVPKAIADLVDVGAYRNRSIELATDLEIGGKVYSSILTGMAFLGADIPAVQGLSDITSLYSAQGLSLADKTRAVVFTSTKTRFEEFTMPKDMSYNDLSQALVSTFISDYPGAEQNGCWVSDVYENYAIFCLEGKWWEQDYEVSEGGDVILKGTPTEVQRVTRWAPVSSGYSRYVDQAEHLLADATAFVDRTEKLVNLRAKDGHTLSQGHQDRLKKIHADLSEVVVKMAKVNARKSTADKKSKLRQSLLQAELSFSSIREDYVGN